MGAALCIRDLYLSAHEVDHRGAGAAMAHLHRVDGRRGGAALGDCFGRLRGRGPARKDFSTRTKAIADRQSRATARPWHERPFLDRAAAQATRPRYIWLISTVVA